MYLSTLSEWLSWIASIHHQEMEFGLERIRQVAERMQLQTAECPVVIVGGTNGKGSTVAGLEAIYLATGRHVGAFTSPIVFKHNEQVRVDGENPTDDEFCQAFSEVEKNRDDISLTPFEFHTLAALVIFKTHKLDVLILEVGLGGRLDAVNLLDADVAVVTSIGIDHIEYLGSTREHIGYEKAGIFRVGCAAVCGDSSPPASLVDAAEKIGAKFFCQGKDFGWIEEQDDWTWTRHGNKNTALTYSHLPLSTLALQNMSTVLMTVALLQDRLPVTRAQIDRGLSSVQLIGRQQVILGDVTEIYDVSHNIDSVRWLANKLKKLPCSGKKRAVFSMLVDKDMLGCIELIKEEINEWHVAPLQVTRSRTEQQLRELFSQAEIETVTLYQNVADAYSAAKHLSKPGDRIIIFGSFHTVAEVARVSGIEAQKRC